jgi:hypothetical protein
LYSLREPIVNIKKNSKRKEEMERKRIIYLFLFVVLILVFSSCHPRHVSDIQPNMTKGEVVSLWGGTNLVTHKTVEGKTIEMKGEEADLFWMTLICVGGHGFRTCVEIVFMTVEAGVVNEGERVVSIAETGRGAEAAIVMKGPRFEDAVGEHAEKRVKIEEILAMPKQTEWSRYG